MVIIDGDNRVIITDECFFIVTFIVADSCLPFYYWCSFHFGMCKGKEGIAGCFKKFQAVETLVP